MTRPAVAMAVAAWVAAWVAACAGGDTGSLIPPTTPLPPEAPRVAGLERADEREHARLVASFGGEYRAPALQAAVAEITARLVTATDRPDEAYRVTILNTPTVNAFALPSGRLYVTRGLLALAGDRAELAAVLAHEIAHVTLRHAAARGEIELKSALLSRVAAQVFNDPRAAEDLRNDARFTVASFSRTQELEADQAGIQTLTRAGFDPYGATRFLDALGRTAALRARALGESGAPAADRLSTHPSTPERIATALQAARRLAAPGIGTSDRAAYLALLEGLAYGDDPADGLVRGRTFLHARLGVAFEAPEGFSLENSARAVLGVSGDGTRRLLFDAIEVRADEDLNAVLQATWTDPIEPGSAETTTINGVPAATATSKGRDWTFRLAAVRIGGTTFRLILAARTLNGEAERAFRRTLESVRALAPEEARALRPLRLRIVTAAEGDTVESLAERMLVPDRNVERFQVLNGLERGARVRAGERYKIVAD